MTAISIKLDAAEALAMIERRANNKAKIGAALDETAELGVTAISAYTPVRRGHLRAATQVVSRSAYGRVIGNSRDYAAPIEYGAKAHTITARGRSLRSESGRYFGKKVNHPGNRPYHMFERGAKTVFVNMPSIFERHLAQ